MHGYVVSNNSLATQTENSCGTNNDILTDEFTVIDVRYGSDHEDENRILSCLHWLGIKCKKIYRKLFVISFRTREIYLKKTTIYFDIHESQTGN